MSELRKMLREEYSKKESVVSADSLIKIIEEMMVLSESLGILTENEGAPGTVASAEAHLQRERILRRVPIPQFSELGWGTAATHDDIHIVIPSSAERNALALYLNNIGGGNLKEKIERLNGFIDNPPVDDIKTSMSFLVFYRTLSMIIHHFNPSSAGFLFESFLAVLLDSSKGRQIPASDGKTIADIIVQAPGSEGEEIAISIKLYAETTLVVGGSYRQLIDDLTGEYPVMQYLVVTKDIDAATKEVNKLNFYSFTLTKENIVRAFHFLNPKLLTVPAIFSSENAGEYARMQLLPDDDPASLEKYLTLPPKALVDITNNFERFKDSAAQSLANVDSSIGDMIDERNGVIKGLNADLALNPRAKTAWSPLIKNSPTEIANIFLQNVEENYDDKGKLKGAPRDIYMFSGAGSTKLKGLEGKTYKTYKQWKIIDAMLGKTMENITGGMKGRNDAQRRILSREIRVLYITIITSAFQAAMPQESDDQSDDVTNLRDAKNAILYGVDAIEGDAAKALLESLRDPSPDKYNRALKATEGYQKEWQFEFRKTKLLELLERADLVQLDYVAGNDPDAPGAFASLEVGRDKVYGVVKKVLAGIDRSLDTIFDQLELLQGNINKYVAGGLTESPVAVAAENNARVISDKTAQVRTEAEGIGTPKASSGGVGLGKTVRRTGRESPVGRVKWQENKETT